MKIAFVSSYPNHWWAGCEDLWSETAVRLLNAGHEVYANITSYPEMPAKITELAGLGCRITFRPTLPAVRPSDSALQDPKGAWLEGVRPDMTVISEGEAFEAADWLALCRIKQVPYMTVTHGVTPWNFADDRRLDDLRASYRGAVRCFFAAEENLLSMRDMIADDLPNAAIVRNPFRVPYEVKLPWPSTKEGCRLACVGTAEPRKGQDILLRVLNLTKWRRRPLKVSLFVCGGFNHRVLFDNITRFHLEDKVSLRTNSEEAVSIWREHHALVLPSRREGLPLVLTEAALCGRPAIVTDVGGNKELVEHHKNGFLAAGASVELFDRAMETAWRMRWFWQSMGRAAARKARSLMPPDPAQIFAGQILSAIREGQPSGRSS